MAPPSDWIAPTGLRAVDIAPQSTAIPDAVLADPGLSLTAKGIYALVLSYQGQPIDPYQDAIEDEQDIREAIDELVAAGYVVRV